MIVSWAKSPKPSRHPDQQLLTATQECILIHWIDHRATTSKPENARFAGIFHRNRRARFEESPILVFSTSISTIPSPDHPSQSSLVQQSYGLPLKRSLNCSHAERVTKRDWRYVIGTRISSNIHTVGFFTFLTSISSFKFSHRPLVTDHSMAESLPNFRRFVSTFNLLE